jgi:phosphohistidine phosphatase SixA
MNKSQPSKSLQLLIALGLTSAMGTTVNAEEISTIKSETLTTNSYLLAQGGEGGEGADYSAGEKANADFQDKMSGIELLNALRRGGFVIYIRHAQTEKDYADQVTANPLDCSTQRMLSEVGWNQSKAIGEAFKKYSIPVNDVISSQYCRAWQTADLAFGKYQKNAALNFPKAEDYTPEQEAQMKAQLTPLLTAAPPQGKNTVIVGHDDLFEAATGIYPAPQGMAYVIKPDGQGGFELIANLRSEEWGNLGTK